MVKDIGQVIEMARTTHQDRPALVLVNGRERFSGPTDDAIRFINEDYKTSEWRIVYFSLDAMEAYGMVFSITRRDSGHVVVLHDDEAGDMRYTYYDVYAHILDGGLCRVHIDGVFDGTISEVWSVAEIQPWLADHAMEIVRTEQISDNRAYHITVRQDEWMV